MPPGRDGSGKTAEKRFPLRVQITMPPLFYPAHARHNERDGTCGTKMPRAASKGMKEVKVKWRNA